MAVREPKWLRKQTRVASSNTSASSIRHQTNRWEGQASGMSQPGKQVKSRGLIVEQKESGQSVAAFCACRSNQKGFRRTRLRRAHFRYLESVKGESVKGEQDQISGYNQTYTSGTLPLREAMRRQKVWKLSIVLLVVVSVILPCDAQCGSVDRTSREAVRNEVNRLFNKSLDVMEVTLPSRAKATTWTGWDQSTQDQISCLGTGEENPVSRRSLRDCLLPPRTL